MCEQGSKKYKYKSRFISSSWNLMIFHAQLSLWSTSPLLLLRVRVRVCVCVCVCVFPPGLVHTTLRWQPGLRHGFLWTKHKTLWFNILATNKLLCSPTNLGCIMRWWSQCLPSGVYYEARWTYPGFLGKPGSTNMQLAIRVKWYHDAHLGFDLSSQVFCFSFHACSLKTAFNRVILLTFTKWIDQEQHILLKGNRQS